MRMRSVGSIVAVAAMTCVRVAADDKWELESPSFYVSDDTVSTPNQLLHGAVQTHDIQGLSTSATVTDQDFSVVATKTRHSYQVRVFNTNVCLLGAAAGCASLARVAGDGTTVLTAGIEPDGRLLPGNYPCWLAVRWIASADEFAFIRVNGYTLGVAAVAANQYDIQMLDTTYLLPRWNNSGTQITIFLIQNGSTSPITGSIFFYDAGGALLATQPLSLAGNSLQVVSTAGIPALAGASGSAAIAHDGGYGALAGKAVALEPSTGFTFDTLIAPIPH